MHYSLDLAFDPSAKTVSGTVTTQFTQAHDAMLSLRVDMAQSLEAKQVTLDGQRAVFTHHGDVLTVTLPGRVVVVAMHTLVIGYFGKPSMKGIHFGELFGQPVIGSYGMPYSAKQWWPNLDDPALKADSADIDITVPAGLVAASNGTLLEDKALADGRHEFHWHESAPIYSDVISVAIAPYVEVRDSVKSITGHTIPLIYYLYKQDQVRAKSEFAIVPDVLHTYERLFGPYPFQHDKYGIAEFPIPSFREHQTLPSLGRGLIVGTSPVWDLGNVSNVIAHDMAHQWFGNSLTLKSWSDVWLNEGFATYAVALWREHHDGKAGYEAFMDSLDAASFPGPLYIKNKSSLDDLLTPTTFNKGAWVLHMLRHVMGDKTFSAALHDYVGTHHGGVVDTHSWIAACERAYGKPLDWFFTEWVYGEGRPTLHVKWTQTKKGNVAQLQLEIDQTQIGQIFTMPVDVKVTTVNSTRTQTVWLRHRHETIALPAQGIVKDVALDPDGWLLKARDLAEDRTSRTAGDEGMARRS